MALSKFNINAKYLILRFKSLFSKLIYLIYGETITVYLNADWLQELREDEVIL